MNETRSGDRDTGRPALIITMRDVDASARNRLEALQVNDVILDEASEIAAAVVYEQLPSIVAKKLTKITPKDFVVGEIECKFRLVGKIPPIELNGEVTVKFRPGNR